MVNIFIEGIQGSGKSTLVNHISKLDSGLRVCREGDYSPIELAWCAWMDRKEYESILEKYKLIKDEIIRNTIKEQGHYIVTYTQILTDIPGFHKDLENYEIYNGRRTFAEFKQIIFNRFKKFSEAGYLFECSWFQNIVEDLILFHMLSDEEIIEFYRELFEMVDRRRFFLFYLYTDRLEETIRIIQKERCDDEGNELWYHLVLEYICNSPYGKAHDYQTFEDMISHLKHRQEVELSIIREIMGENATVIPAKSYEINDIMSSIRLREILD